MEAAIAAIEASDLSVGIKEFTMHKAMRYMLKHWHELTQFLRVAGAPLDNNILERALNPDPGPAHLVILQNRIRCHDRGHQTSMKYTCALAHINRLNGQ
nr:transposase [Legionella qingyii]